LLGLRNRSTPHPCQFLSARFRSLAIDPKAPKHMYAKLAEQQWRALVAAQSTGTPKYVGCSAVPSLPIKFWRTWG